MFGKVVAFRLLLAAGLGIVMIPFVIFAVGDSVYHPTAMEQLVVKNPPAPGLSPHVTSWFIFTSTWPVVEKAFSTQPNQTGILQSSDLEATTPTSSYANPKVDRTTPRTGPHLNVGLDYTIHQLPSATLAAQCLSKLRTVDRTGTFIVAPEPTQRDEAGEVFYVTYQNLDKEQFFVTGIPHAFGLFDQLEVKGSPTVTRYAYNIGFTVDNSVVDMTLERTHQVGVSTAIAVAQAEYHHLKAVDPTLSLTAPNPIFVPLLVAEFILIPVEIVAACILLREYGPWRRKDNTYAIMAQAQLEQRYAQLQKSQSEVVPKATPYPSAERNAGHQPSRASPARQTAQTKVPAGWYPPDPADQNRLRWWDGERWTDHISVRADTRQTDE